MPFESPARMLELHQAAWRERREKTVTAYRLKQEAEEALTRAEASNGDYGAWNKAYRAAKASDVVVHELLVYKLQEFLTADGGLFTPGSRARHLFVLSLGIVAMNRLLKVLTPIDSETINDFSHDLLALVMLAFFMTNMLAMREDLDRYLHWVSFHRDLSDEVQHLALEARIELGLAGKELADSNSLISQITHARNNEKVLEDISCTDVPLEFCCAIKKSVMTDCSGQLKLDTFKNREALKKI